MSTGDPVADFIRMRYDAIAAGADYCLACGQVNAWPHDHQPDNTGLDDGPWLPGCAPRKKPDPKSAAELTAIRKRAWQTRRNTYGQQGHL